jgi:predicted outer membrane protein
MTIQRSYLLPLALALAVATATAGCGQATTGAGMAPAASPQGTAAGQVAPSDQDRIWMKKIHRDYLAEKLAGELAERKGAAAAVRELGAKLVTAHTELDAELIQTAARLGVELPAAPSGEQEKAGKALEEAAGKDFDRAFLTAMRKRHATTMGQTRMEIKKGSSPEVKAMAKSALQVMRHHSLLTKKALEES